MNNITYISKALTLFSLLAISSLSGLFGSSNEDEPSLRTIPIMEASGDAMPGWEKQIIELYHDEEGNPLPIVFRGAAKNWEAASWTPEWFAEKFGDVEIEVISQNTLESLNEHPEGPEIPTPSKEDVDCQADEKRLSTCDKDGMNCREECFLYDEKEKIYYKREDREDYETRVNPIHTTIKDHITDIFQNSKNATYFICPLPHNITKEQLNYGAHASDTFAKNSIFAYDNLILATQTQFPESIIGINEVEGRSYILLIGSENSVTSLHNHESTFLAQMYGKKIARLVHPKDIKKCYCKRADEIDEFVEKCDIDITAPDFAKYPDLKDLEVYETILEPGDVLYIPEAWLHDIRGLSTSISIASGF